MGCSVSDLGSIANDLCSQRQDQLGRLNLEADKIHNDVKAAGELFEQEVKNVTRLGDQLKDDLLTAFDKAIQGGQAGSSNGQLGRFNVGGCNYDTSFHQFNAPQGIASMTSFSLEQDEDCPDQPSSIELIFNTDSKKLAMLDVLCDHGNLTSYISYRNKNFETTMGGARDIYEPSISLTQAGKGANAGSFYRSVLTARKYWYSNTATGGQVE